MQSSTVSSSSLGLIDHGVFGVKSSLADVMFVDMLLRSVLLKSTGLDICVGADLALSCTGDSDSAPATSSSGEPTGVVELGGAGEAAGLS